MRIVQAALVLHQQMRLPEEFVNVSEMSFAAA